MEVESGQQPKERENALSLIADLRRDDEGSLPRAFPEQPYDLFLVTGASSNHFHSLIFTISNAHAREPNLPVVVWDFGLAVEEVEQVKRWRNVEYRLFNFTDYPEWMQMHAAGKGQVNRMSRVSR